MATTDIVRDSGNLTPAEVERREYVIHIISEVCKSNGLEPLGDLEAFFGIKIDTDSKAAEAKLILAVNEALDQLGVKNFAIYLSHSGVLTGILETVGVPEILYKQTFGPIRNFSKFNIEGFVNELETIGVSEKASGILADLFLKTDEVLNQEHDINRTVVSNLLNIVDSETLTELGQILQSTGRKPVFIDPALPCESPFSPGIVIEARTSGLVFLGEGGCMDEKAPVFTFSFDIDNIIALVFDSGA